MKALPIIAIAAAIGTLVYGIYQYVSANKDASKEEEKRKKNLEEQKKLEDERTTYMAKESSQFLELIYRLKATNVNSVERSKLIKQINNQYGTTLKNLSDENQFQSQLNTTVAEYVQLQYNKYKLMKNDEAFQNLNKQKYETEKKLYELQNATNKNFMMTADQRAAALGDYQAEIRVRNELGRIHQDTNIDQLIEIKRINDIKTQMKEYKNTLSSIEKQQVTLGGVRERLIKIDDDLTKGGKVYVDQTKNNTDVIKDDTKAIEENIDARSRLKDALQGTIEEQKAVSEREKEILKERQKIDNLLKLQAEAIAEVEKNRANGIYKTAEAYKTALGGIKLDSEEYLKAQLEIIKKEGEARKKSSNVTIGGGGEDPKEVKKREKALKDQMDLVKKNFEEQIKNADVFQNTLRAKEEEINKKWDLIDTQNAKLVELELQKIQLDSLQQQELNTATTEEDKLNIRKSYADRIRVNEEELVKQQAIIQLRDTSLTEEQRQKIIAESENKILKLREKAVDDTVTSTQGKFDIFTEMRIAFAENNAEFQKNWSENWITTLQDLVGEIAQITGQITDLFSQAFQVAADNQLASLERLTAQEQEQLNASLVNREITDKQYEEKKKLLEKSAEERKKQIEIKEFRRQKALNIVNAVMNTAVGVTKALPNPILMALAAVLGIAQVAIISSQQFRAAQGGVVPQNGQSGNVDSVPSLLAPGEVVINSQSSQMFPQLLSDINQAGGGKRLVPEVAFTNPYNQTNVFQPQQQMVQAYVVESQITNSQRRISRMERAASF